MFIASGGPISNPGYHRFAHRAASPLVDLARGHELTVVAAMSGDGEVVIGQTYLRHHGHQNFRWRDGVLDVQGPSESAGRPADVSGDGGTIAGDRRIDQNPRLAFRYGELSTSLPPAGGRVHSFATAISADASVVVGWSGGSGEDPVATSWGGPLGNDALLLGVLPGETASEALGVSADGSTVVGHSGARAFRWQAGVLQDLGPGEARAASADGSVVLGDSFLWDAENGRRELKQAIEADFDVDLSAWQRVIGTDLSPDGLTIVGAAAWPGGALRAFRARRAAEACPERSPEEPFPLIVPEMLDDLDVEWVERPRVSPDGTAYLGTDSSKVLPTRERSGPDDPWSPVEIVLELPDDDRALVIAAGPEGEGYVSTASEKLLRIDLDGSVTEIFDGSVFVKPIVNEGTEFELAVATQAIEIARAPDGTLFVAAVARALRIDPDGSVSELFDMETWPAWIGRERGLFRVQRHPDGRIFWGDTSAVVVTDASGNLLELIWDAESITFDAEGDLWARDSDGLFHWGPGGDREFVDLVSSDGTRWRLRSDSPLAFDADGDLYFVADGSTPGREDHLIRRSPDGQITPILPHDRRFSLGNESVFLEGYREIRQIRTSPLLTACRNGRDDDGDGLVDLADPGCSSDLDATERSDALVCDNGRDDDGDGLADFPDDPGCASWSAPTEAPECSDGVDNDLDGRIDWDGAGVGAPDPQCAGGPAQETERTSCGLGFELALLGLAVRRRARRRRRKETASPYAGEERGAIRVGDRA